VSEAGDAENKGIVCEEESMSKECRLPLETEKIKEIDFPLKSPERIQIC
jgi:hypothetical protein